MTSVGSVWRLTDFRTLFVGLSFSQLGTHIAYVGVPLVAVLALDAGAGQVGALAALSTAAFLLIGLPAGAWVDRMRRRNVLICADAARALLLATIPVAWSLDRLTLGQLYAVVLLNGCATVFFEVGSQSILPQVVGRDGLVQANTAVVTLMAAGNVAGRGAGGGLVQVLSAPITVACAVAAYLSSALNLARIRQDQTPPAAAARSVGLPQQIGEGVRHVFGNPELRALAMTAALINVGTQTVITILPIIFVRELGLPAGLMGLFLALGGVGLLLGARTARGLAERLGHGRALATAGLCLAPAGLLVPVIDNGPTLVLASLGWLLVTTKTGMDNVLGVSLRQRLTPDLLLGRMNATFRFLLTGAHTIGAAVAGVIGEAASARAALWAGGCCLALSFLPVYFSPVRSRLELPPPALDGVGQPQRASS